MPKTSQYLYQYLGPEILGGKPLTIPFRDILDGQHEDSGGKGVLKHRLTKDIIRDYQALTGLAKLP